MSVYSQRPEDRVLWRPRRWVRALTSSPKRAAYDPPSVSPGPAGLPSLPVEPSARARATLGPRSPGCLCPGARRWRTGRQEEGPGLGGEAGRSAAGRGVCGREPAGSRAGFCSLQGSPGGDFRAWSESHGSCGWRSPDLQPRPPALAGLGSAQTVTQTSVQTPRRRGLPCPWHRPGRPCRGWKAPRDPTPRCPRPPLQLPGRALEGTGWGSARPASPAAHGSRGEGWLRDRGFPVESERPLIGRAPPSRHHPK